MIIDTRCLLYRVLADESFFFFFFTSISNAHLFCARLDTKERGQKGGEWVIGTNVLTLVMNDICMPEFEIEPKQLDSEEV